MRASLVEKQSVFHLRRVANEWDEIVEYTTLLYWGTAITHNNCVLQNVMNKLAPIKIKNMKNVLSLANAFAGTLFAP